MPVLGSLLAGLSLPVQEASSETSSSDSPDSLVWSKSPLTVAQLAPVVQGMQKGVNVVELNSRLQELDEMSKRRVDVLEHFTVSKQASCLFASLV